ncbi:alpha/beta fold hydrolase [Candidatus Woesearchaeota archaeon]|nr:alpha/beta fold hydrolase [Candidatus Woesearchaeota archaeon]
MAKKNKLKEFEEFWDRKRIITSVIIVAVAAFWVYVNTGLETYPADTYLSSIQVLDETVTFDRYVMDRTQPIFYNRGPTAVLLLHGFGGSPYELKEMAEYLAQRNISVYAPLLAGHGSTIDYLSKVTWQEVVEDANRALQILKRNYDKVYVGGICNGGLTALYLAENEDFDGVISMATPIYVSFKWLEYLPTRQILQGLRLITKYVRKITYGAVMDNDAVRGMPVFEGAPVTELINVFDLSDAARENLAKIDEPVLIIQSLFDNRAAPESAQFIFETVSSEDKTLVYLNNSAHIITVDYDKHIVNEGVYKFVSR